MRFEKNLRSSAVVGEADFCAVMRESVSTHSLKRGVNESRLAVWKVFVVVLIVDPYALMVTALLAQRPFLRPSHPPFG
jgi:hypothetical protein